MAFQAERNVYHAQLKMCQDTIQDLIRNGNVPPEKVSKDNIVVIIEKNSTLEENLYEQPYYISRIKRCFITRKNEKKRRFKAQYPHYRLKVKWLDNPHSTRLFNRFEGHLERFHYHFNLLILHVMLCMPKVRLSRYAYLR